MGASRRGMCGSMAVVALVAIGVAACSGSDTIGASGDAGPSDAAASNEAGMHPPSDGGASTDSGRAADGGGTPDGNPSQDGSPSLDAGAPLDAGRADETSLADSSTGDATVPSDGGPAEAEAAASPPPAVALCGALDTAFMLNEADASPTQATYDRTQWWVYSINANFFTSANNDCRFTDMFGAALTAADGSTAAQDEYTNSMDTFTLQFMGCPLPTDAGALTFGLIPPSLSSHVFSSSDLEGLKSLYADAITSTLQCGGPCPPNDGTLPNSAANFQPLPALANDQVTAIRAQLDYLASAVQGTVTSSTYTFDSCPPDAGTDAPQSGDDSSAAPADGPTGDSSDGG